MPSRGERQGALDWCGRLTERRQLRDGRAAELVALLLDAVARPNRTAAQAPFDEVDAPAL